MSPGEQRQIIIAEAGHRAMEKGFGYSPTAISALVDLSLEDFKKNFQKKAYSVNEGIAECTVIIASIDIMISALKKFLRIEEVNKLTYVGVVKAIKDATDKLYRDTQAVYDAQELSNAPEPNCPDPCVRCGKLTVYYRLIQTRSSDEAQTIQYRCLACGERHTA